jgi:transposase InsO family protein
MPKKFEPETRERALRMLAEAMAVVRRSAGARGRKAPCRELRRLWPPQDACTDASSGLDIGRDQTERLMRAAGVRGVKRSKQVFTTKRDRAAPLPADLVQRRFTAAAPRRLWVADITYVVTWSGFAYVAFVTDVFSRRIVGWNVAATLRADILPLKALNMAVWTADGAWIS